MSKKRVLFIGSFIKQGKDGNVGGQMFACKSLVNSSLADDVEWVLIDTTAKTNKKRNLIARLLPAIIRILKAVYHLLFSKVDIVIAFSSSGFSFLEKGCIIKLAKSLGKKTIIAPRSGHLIDEVTSNKKFKSKIKKILDKSDYIICQGTFWKSFFEKELSINSSKLQVIPNWIDASLYENKREEENTPTKILFLGWVTQNKGIYDLLAAVKEIKNKNFILEIAGNGDEYENVEELIKEEDLSNKVKLLGWIYGQEKNKLLNKADIFVLPSYREGMPNALLEAMASNTAVIATNVGGIPDLISSGDNGVMVKPGDEKAIKEALLLYLNNKEKAREHAQKALEHIRTNNTITGVIPKFQKMFNLNAS